jgi:glycosyltransferase involved in cell wall biosynthesis
VVHVMSQDTAIAAAIALADRAPGERPALVAMFSEIGTQEVPYGRARARFAYRLPQVAKHAALSRRYAEVALGHGVPEERVRLTYGGIDLDRARSGSRARSRAALELDDDDVLVACPSRFTVRKGQMDLLEGFELAHASEPRLRLALAGTAHSGSEEFRRRIEDEIAARGLGSVARVVLDAHYDRLPDVLAAADVVAQPSHFEGLGFSALEAMAAERPVLLTRVPGFVEFARHGENAWVAPGHDPQALAEGLLALARDPDLRQRLVAEGVRTAEEFSAERFVSRVLDVYDECLQPAPA